MEQTTTFSTLRVSLYPEDSQPCLTSANDILRMIAERVQVPVQPGPAGAAGKDSDAFDSYIELDFQKREYVFVQNTSSLTIPLNENETGVNNDSVQVYFGPNESKLYIFERVNSATGITIRTNVKLGDDATVICSWQVPRLIVRTVDENGDPIDEEQETVPAEEESA